MAKFMSTMFLFLVAGNLLLSAEGEKLVPCYYIFGDSLVDNGNNNGRNTTAKANYRPYGVDFPGGSTGRFTNGRNVADFIAEALGFTDHIPPFASTTGAALLSGVNYASGGSGILGGTGKQLGDVISLDNQLHNHQTTVKETISTLGINSAMDHLSSCMYTVGLGSNDYAAYANAAVKPTPEEYASQLITEYSRQLRDLHKSGARKVALFGLGTIGCVPSALNGSNYGPQCLSATRSVPGVFNGKLKSLVDVLNKGLVGAKFTYIDVYGIVASDPTTNGFKFENVPCCKIIAGGLQCVPNGPTCSDRRQYAYFDGVHPTEAAAMTVAKRAFTAKAPSDAYPVDIQHLARA